MKNIILIDASPKISDETASKCLVDMMSKHISDDTAHKTIINVRQSLSRHKTDEDYKTIFHADAVVIAFPLYVFCMPGILMRYLQDYYGYYADQKRISRKPKVYAIVNCGFPEPDINSEAVRVVKSFSRRINAEFRFGVLIGGGGMIAGARHAPFMKKTMRSLNDAFSKIARDIQSDDLPAEDNINIAMNFPNKLYRFMGDRGWIHMASRNGLKKKDLYRKPYLEN